MQKIFSILTIFSLLITSSSSFATDITGGTNLPYNLYLDAIVESPEYDPQFDYLKLGTTIIKIDPPLKDKNLVDKVVVKKSLYRMYLYYKDKLIKTYLIALGQNPKGHKMFEGDKKTPEGKYILDYIKLNSNYYKAFHISYPNAQDIQFARSKGKNPGGMIMVHGQPAKRKNTPGLDGIQSSNWTDGCIALMNDDMDSFLELVDPGTTIIIEP
jgi:murein L,D-transpeptidase YafK